MRSTSNKKTFELENAEVLIIKTTFENRKIRALKLLKNIIRARIETTFKNTVKTLKTQ